VRRHPESGKRHLDVLHLGIAAVSHRGRQSRRALAETVTTSGMYRGAFARRRCLVPAAAFYEWKVIEGGK
jgi:putative SOS response-associated peptidase YedK